MVYSVQEKDKKPLMIGKEYTARANCFYSKPDIYSLSHNKSLA